MNQSRQVTQSSREETQVNRLNVLLSQTTN